MAHEKKVVETPVEYDPQYILQVKDLKKHFPIKGGMISKTVGHVKAVDGVTFNLKRGTTMGLVGESGCGKTTTGRTILRLAGEKTGGQVLFNGKDVYALSDKEMRDMRTKMQIIFQDPFSSLQPRMPVGEIIGEAVREHGLVSKESPMGKALLAAEWGTGPMSRSMSSTATMWRSDSSKRGRTTALWRSWLPGLVKGHQEFSRLAVRDLQLAAQRRKALVALHTQLGHEAPRAVVEAGVDHGGVAAAGSGGHVGLLLHQGHRPLGTGQLPGNGTAHGAAADDEDIIGSV